MRLSRTFKIAIVIFLIFASAAFSWADNEKAQPNAAIGFGGSFGRYNIYTPSRGSDTLEWSNGYGIQGGFVFEQMFSNRIGIQSGLWYGESKIKVYDGKNAGDISLKTLSMPFYFVLSFNSQSVGFNFLGGFNFTRIVASDYNNNSIINEILLYVNENQIAMSGGFNIKFRITSFTDFFIGMLADFSLNKFINDTIKTDVTHLYNIRGTGGFMFRTNIFPISEKL